VVSGNFAYIAVQGPDNQLLVYWQPLGASNWDIDTVATDTFFAPSMVVNGDTINIAVDGPLSTVLFYWTFIGSGTWTTETVAGGPGTLVGPPSLVVDGNTFYITAAQFISTSWDLAVWYDTIGTGTWHRELLGPGLADTPAITANGSNINISVVSPSGAIMFYWGSLGTWYPETVAGANTSSTSIGSPSPSIAVSGDGVTIAATGEQGQLLFYYAVTGTGFWIPETVAGANTTSSSPSIVSDPSADVGAITAVSPGGQLDFYWNIDGTSGWNPETLPGTGIE
jgi:hypothetical protein